MPTCSLFYSANVCSIEPSELASYWSNVCFMLQASGYPADMWMVSRDVMELFLSMLSTSFFFDKNLSGDTVIPLYVLLT